MNRIELKTVKLRRGRDRWAVIADGETVIKTDYEILYRLGVFSKTNTNEKELGFIKDEVELYEAKKRALYLISLRSHAGKELERKLRQKGFSAAAAQGAVGYMHDHGYIDDAEFALELTRSLSSRGWGENRIRSELYGRGVDRETIDTVIGPGSESEAQCDIAKRVLRKKLTGRKMVPEDRGKLYAFMVRRGFSHDDIDAAFRMIGEADEGDESIG